MKPGHRAVEHVLCITRRMLAVEDVARDQQRIYLALSDNFYECVESALLLIRAAVAADRLPQVPVGSMKDAQVGSPLSTISNRSKTATNLPAPPSIPSLTAMFVLKRFLGKCSVTL